MFGKSSQRRWAAYHRGLEQQDMRLMAAHDLREQTMALIAADLCAQLALAPTVPSAQAAPVPLRALAPAA